VKIIRGVYSDPFQIIRENSSEKVFARSFTLVCNNPDIFTKSGDINVVIGTLGK